MTRRSLVGVVVVLVAVLTGACGGVRHGATLSIVATKGALDLTQDTEPLLVCGEPTAPPIKCVSPTTHRQIHGVLARAYDLHKSLTVAVRDWPADAPQPAGIAQYLEQITELLDQVIGLLPDGSIKTRLIALVRTH